MNLRRKLRAGLAGGIAAMTWWICAPLQAQQPASAADAAAPAFAKGPLPPRVAEQVHAIMMAQVKAFLPPSEQGVVALIRLDKDTVLTATVDGQTYSARVFRQFLVAPLSPTGFDAKEYYVRTTAPWNLKAGPVIPADTYLSGTAERVSAYDADMIAAQDAAIARSDAFCKGALNQLEPERKAKAAAIAEAHKADLDALTKKVTQLNADIAQTLKARDKVATLISLRQPTRPMTGRDADNKVIWQYTPGKGLTFSDGLDESRQALDQATEAQKTLQATMDAEVTAALGKPGVKEKALRAVFQTHRRRILAGETISEEEMRADYESLLAGPLPHDILSNGDFQKSEAGMPLGWEYYSFTPSRSSAHVVEDDQAPGRRCFLIENKELDDSYLKQVVTLAPGAVYKLSGRIKTQDIVNQKAAGAYIWMEGEVTLKWLNGRFVTGTRDWQQFAVEISTPTLFKPDSRLTVECRLGDYGDGVSGKAWFADVTLSRIR